MESREPHDKRQQERFMTDTEKIIHRHLSNKDDVITEEDIRSVRIGISPNEADVDHPQMQEEENGWNNHAGNSPDTNQKETDQREGRDVQLPK